MSSEERLARLETKVDSMQHELTEFKDTFHKDFKSHQSEDDKNFSKLNDAINETQKTQVGIKASIETRLNASDRNQRNWGLTISTISVIVAIIVALK